MKNKKGFVLGTAVVTLGVNIATIFGGTYAWMCMNKSVEATGMQIKAGNPNNVEIIEKHIYAWDYQTDTPIETTDLNLEPYDCFITTRNDDARKFLRLKLKYPNGIPENTSLSISVECTGNLFKKLNNVDYVDTNISNLIQFKYYDNKLNSIDTTSVDSIYHNCKSIFNDMDTLSTFVEISNSGEQKSASKDSYTIVSNDITLEATEASEFTTELFIEYTYNEELLEYYQDNSGVEFDLSVFTGSTEISFEPDVTKISIDLATQY